MIQVIFISFQRENDLRRWLHPRTDHASHYLEHIVKLNIKNDKPVIILECKTHLRINKICCLVLQHRNEGSNLEIK